jgi:hypothetical protein
MPSRLFYSSNVHKTDYSAFYTGDVKDNNKDSIANAYTSLSTLNKDTASDSISSLYSSLSSITAGTTQEELPFAVQDHDNIGSLQTTDDLFFPPTTKALQAQSHRRAVKNALAMDMFFASGSTVKNEWAAFL